MIGTDIKITYSPEELAFYFKLYSGDKFISEARVEKITILKYGMDTFDMISYYFKKYNIEIPSINIADSFVRFVV